jgi:hypothetical protein
MIYIIDDFLPKNLYDSLVDYSNDFEKVETPGKSFWIKQVPEELSDYIINRIEKIEGRKIKNIFTFIREAKHNQDDDWRIHNDAIIQGEQPDRASVLFLKSNEEGLNGTALWKHKVHGYTYNDIVEDEFNKLLINDANDVDKWELNSVIGYKDNRLLSYPCNYFHSKYPNKFKNQRIVLVIFYKYEK